MGYVEQSLSSGEQVVLKARLHWGMFVGPIFRLLIGIGVVLVAITPALNTVIAFYRQAIAAAPEQAVEFTKGFPNDATSLLLICNCLAWPYLLGGIVQIFSRISTYVTTEFAVTNKRVIGKAGMLRRRSLEVMLSKVESIQVSEPLLGRLLNYGTLVVRGSGGTTQPFPFIANAMELRKQINNLMPVA